MLPIRVITAVLCLGVLLNHFLGLQSHFALLSCLQCHRSTLFFLLSEMRRKFDAGEDPLDAESQQGGGNPFHRNWNTWQGFNPFGSGGGPFTFKFHFS